MTTEASKPVNPPPAVEEPVKKKQKVADAPANSEPKEKVEKVENAENVEMKDAPAPEAEKPAPAAEGSTDKPAANDEKPAEEKNAEEKPAETKDEEASTWSNHKLNVNNGLMKDSEGMRFSDVATSKCDILQGIGEKSVEVCENFGVKTVADLAEYKFYKIAKAIAALAPLEEKDGRKASSVMNVDAAVDVKFETSTFGEILEAPVSALQGLGEKTAALLGELNVKTVKDLSTFKYCMWAEAIVTLAKFEHTKEDKRPQMLKRLD